MTEHYTPPGWLKKKGAAQYMGLSPRKTHDLFNQGLRHIRLPSGMRLTKPEWIDDFLIQFEATGNKVDQVVDEVLEGMQE